MALFFRFYITLPMSGCDLSKIFYSTFIQRKADRATKHIFVCQNVILKPVTGNIPTYTGTTYMKFHTCSGMHTLKAKGIMWVKFAQWIHRTAHIFRTQSSSRNVTSCSDKHTHSLSSSTYIHTHTQKQMFFHGAFLMSQKEFITN